MELPSGTKTRRPECGHRIFLSWISISLSLHINESLSSSSLHLPSLSPQIRVWYGSLWFVGAYCSQKITQSHSATPQRFHGAQLGLEFGLCPQTHFPLLRRCFWEQRQDRQSCHARRLRAEVGGRIEESWGLQTRASSLHAPPKRWCVLVPFIVVIVIMSSLCISFFFFVSPRSLGMQLSPDWKRKK